LTVIEMLGERQA